MKTEPTEACKMIEGSWYAIPHMGTDYQQDSDIVIDKKDVYEIAKKAFQEGQSSPKIKQLEWIPVSSNGKDCLIAWTSLCIAYEIDSSVNPIILFNLDCIAEPFDTIDEAKAAAQADFEQRVKECLV